VDANVGPSRRVVLVPSRCVNQTQDIHSVWVVRPDSTVAYRQVTMGDTYGELWSIDEGLAANEWVVAAGTQKLRNGTKVAPVKRQPESGDPQPTPVKP
ncbi:MAG: hypothetical protein NC226_03045, partial [Bacteroides cellulosilyticus]|nr:hypothetical protein [Bacteroides cellulosilyticus]